MWLPWEWSLPLAGLLAVVSGVARSRGRLGLSALAAESTRIALLYTLWQIAGRLSVAGIDGAVERGLWIWDVQRAILLPNEATMQSWILPHDWLVQAANIYYGGAHVPGMGIFLAWLWWQHRHEFAGWRNVLVVITFVSLMIQLLPVAPPRLIPELGMVDTGVVYGQSVYAIGGSTIAGQLQAMPSLHVGWAALIAVAGWRLGGRTARLVSVTHFVLTALVVVVTANHYWLDGIVVILILAPAVALLRQTRRRAEQRTDPDEPDRSVLTHR